VPAEVTHAVYASVADAVLASIALSVGIGRAWPDPSTRARAIDRV
jgi:hypothetical protein